MVCVVSCWALLGRRSWPAGSHAQGTAGVSTGQGLSMGTTDPYWHYIAGPVNYTSPGALLTLGGPAVVDTLYDYDTSLAVVLSRAEGRDLYPWALRSRAPGAEHQQWMATPSAPRVGCDPTRTDDTADVRGSDAPQFECDPARWYRLGGWAAPRGHLRERSEALSTVLTERRCRFESFRLQDNPALAMSRKAGYTFPTSARGTA